MPEYIERGAAKHAADLAFDMTETVTRTATIPILTLAKYNHPPIGCRCLSRRAERRSYHEDILRS